MTHDTTLLVVDDSEVYRELMSLLMRAHFGRVLTADSVASAIDVIDCTPRLDAVICDLVLGTEDGFAVLRHLQSLASPRPRVLMVTSYDGPEQAECARRLGAVGYLTKPARVSDVLSALEVSSKQGAGDRAPWRCMGHAFAVAPERGQARDLGWRVYDLCPRGAFLETPGPLPVGLEIDLLLEVDGQKGRVRARVARLQDASRSCPGGAWVEFAECSEEAMTAIENSVEAGDSR